MNIEIFIPINTKEKVDKIIQLIQLNQEPKSIYTDILVHIKKMKMQLYFKEKFDNIKATLPYKNENQSFVNGLNKPQSKRSIYKHDAGLHKMRNTANDKLVGVRLFRGMTIAQLSNFIDMPLGIIISIIKQKNKSITNLPEDYILTENIIVPCLDFLQNAYNIKIIKDKKQASFEKEMATAGYCRKKMEERFKPSLGQEGNYRKLIYIRTKT